MVNITKSNQLTQCFFTSVSINTSARNVLPCRDFCSMFSQRQKRVGC